MLEKLSGHHPVVDALLEFRKLEKLLDLSGTAAPAHGRRRTQYPDHVQPACHRHGPPFVQQPEPPEHPGTRSARTPDARLLHCTREGKKLISADYSQIELRVLAHLSRDETLLVAFREGADIHARTASLLFDAPPSEITPDQRRNAKTINFGLIYGMGPQKLAQELKIPLSEAKAFMARYFERLQGLKNFYENVEEMAREQGYVTTLAGRRRPAGIRAESQQARSAARRQAINTLIQGSAADIIKLAMLAVHGDETLRARWTPSYCSKCMTNSCLKSPKPPRRRPGTCRRSWQTSVPAVVLDVPSRPTGEPPRTGAMRINQVEKRRGREGESCIAGLPSSPHPLPPSSPKTFVF